MNFDAGAAFEARIVNGPGFVAFIRLAGMVCRGLSDAAGWLGAE